MQFTTLVLLATGAIAAPAANVVSMAATVPDWTITSMKRVCLKDYSKCTFTFGIDTHTATATACTYVVKPQDGKKPYMSNGGPAACGAFTITSAWSNQFGNDKAFTTLSVVDQKAGVIAYPAYTEKELNAGTVHPDRSYKVQNLP